MHAKDFNDLIALFKKYDAHIFLGAIQDGENVHLEVIHSDLASPEQIIRLLNCAIDRFAMELPKGNA